MRYPLFCALLALATFACSPDTRGRDDDDSTDPAPDAGEVASTPPDAGSVVTNPPDAGHGNPTNHPPSASLVTPTGTRSGDVPVDYLLFDADSDLLSISVEWSEDGSTWHPATSPSATSNLGSSADGSEQLFVWSSGTDLAGRSASVRLRLVPSDASGPGAPAFTASFSVSNLVQNGAPSGVFGALPSTVKGDQPVSLTITDPDGDRVSTTFEFRIAAGAWQRATIVGGNPANLGASGGGSLDTVTWSSATDIPQSVAGVQLRATFDDGHGHTPLPTAASAIFPVDNAPVQTTSGVRITRVNAGAPDWFEVRNNGSALANLAGWSVRYTSPDGSSMALTIPATGTTTLGSGAKAIVTEETGTSGNGTIFLSNAQSTQQISWYPGLQGSLELLDSAGNTVDFVRWGGSSATPSQGSWREPKLLYIPQDGACLVRVQPTTDTDSASDFCAALSPRTGTNGSCLLPAPSGTQIRLNEISLGAGLPATPSGTAARWVELINDGPPVNLGNFVLLGLDLSSSGQVVLPSTNIATGERLLVREGTGGETVSGGVHTIYANTGTFAGTAGSQAIVVLVDPSGAPLDFVRWAGELMPPPAPLTFAASPTVPPPTASYTIGRRTESSTLVAPDAWCVTASPTPGTASSGCQPAPVSTGLRINEVGTGKVNSFFNAVPGFIEVKNASTAVRDLSGYTLRWTGSGTTFPGPGSVVFSATAATVLNPGDHIAIYECGLTGTLGQTCDVQDFPFGEGQANGGAYGSVELLDPAGMSVDFVRWGATTDQPSTGGAWSDSPGALGPIPTVNGPWALARGEYATDTDRAGDWCVQAETPANVNSTCN